MMNHERTEPRAALLQVERGPVMVAAQDYFLAFSGELCDFFMDFGLIEVSYENSVVHDPRI